MKIMRILLLSCSSKKKTEMNIPALELYEGVFFSVIKKAFRENPALQERVRILIVSAKYGLIRAESVISHYDLLMTPEIADKQKAKNTRELLDFIASHQVEEIAVVMGRQYLRSVDFSSLELPVHYITGEIGMMLHGLKLWLHALK